MYGVPKIWRTMWPRPLGMGVWLTPGNMFIPVLSYQISRVSKILGTLGVGAALLAEGVADC